MANFWPGPTTSSGIAQEVIINVKNASNVDTIALGTVVMFAGAAGDTITVLPAVSDGTYPARVLVGIAHESIAPEGFGGVVQLGFIEHLKTDYAGWTVGDLLYVDPATPGALTKTAPLAPNWDFPIAAITRVQQESGRLLVRAIPQPANATIVNTDGDAGTTIYVGSVDPSTIYTLVDGDVWIEVP